MRKLYNEKKVFAAPNLADIIHEFDSNSGDLFWGAGSADFSHIEEYFKDRGIPTSFHCSWDKMNSKLQNMTTNQVAICSYWTKKVPLTGHYVAVEKIVDSKGKELLKVYNIKGGIDNGIDLNKECFNGEFINGYIIGEE